MRAPYAQQAVRISRLEAEKALLTEELRIKDARMARIPAASRPHYPLPERLAVLALRAAAGWSTAETARRFLVTAATIAAWGRRLDEEGEDALVQTPVPVNRFPDFVAALVAQLRVALPTMGKQRIADLLARAGLELSATTIGRLAQRALPPEVNNSGGPSSSRGTKDHQVPATTTKAAGRGVTARYAHHVWHVDLTIVPTNLGFWVPWWPFSLCVRWPFCWWVGAVLDQHSRAILARLVLVKEQTAEDVCAMLDRAATKAGIAARYIDQRSRSAVSGALPSVVHTKRRATPLRRGRQAR